VIGFGQNVVYSVILMSAKEGGTRPSATTAVPAVEFRAWEDRQSIRTVHHRTRVAWQNHLSGIEDDLGMEMVMMLSSRF
jgi:hypothetical protein